MTRRRVAFALLIVLALAGVALARPGGGQSYSGGGGHGGGGGGGGGGDAGAIFQLIYYLLRLVIIYPQVGVPLVCLIIGFFVYSAYKQHQNKDWDSGPPVELQRAVSLTDLRQIDPDFSQVLFEDFAFRLFSTAHRARHTPQTLATVGPYVTEGARQTLAQRPPPGERVESVVIGAMRTFRLVIPPTATDENGQPGRVRIGIEFEANTTTTHHTYYSVESWLFGRDATRTSKPPGASRGFPCPNCGAPWQASSAGTQVCASCGEVVDNGRFDWVVEQISLLSMDERPPTLTEEVPERGTDLPTYRGNDVDRQMQALCADDPAFTEVALQHRLAMIYGELNRAWAQNDLRPVRGFISDGLFDYLQYWIEAYKRQDLRNELVDMRITHMTLAKVERDRWYSAITIRIWGTGKDFVVRASNGEHVRGSRHRERKYSEYWTLIRSAARKGAPVTQPACSNCGAPLRIGQAGECEHCGAHVTAGEFDWVLSKIEQDDSYRG
jgi:uncharacterized Zn finger protein (UPF0148 family)